MSVFKVESFCARAMTGEVKDLGIGVEERSLEISEADGTLMFNLEGIAVVRSTETFGNVSNFWLS